MWIIIYVVVDNYSLLYLTSHLIIYRRIRQTPAFSNRAKLLSTTILIMPWYSSSTKSWQISWQILILLFICSVLSLGIVTNTMLKVVAQDDIMNHDGAHYELEMDRERYKNHSSGYKASTSVSPSVKESFSKRILKLTIHSIRWVIDCFVFLCCLLRSIYCSADNPATRDMLFQPLK